VLLFPKGNNVDHLSIYLDVADSATLPYGWNRFAHFSLAIVNQYDHKLTVKKDTQHQFNVRESDWGFTSFMALQEFYDPTRGFLVNDTLVLEADVSVRKVVDYWAYDSKKETGFVGLKNQGATCYINSLLQTLYHLAYFRKVLSLPPSLSLSLSLLTPQMPKCFTLDIEIFSESLVVLALLAFVVGAQVSGKHRESLRCS
jgi:ubiquitin carboxyl-terminal hydrolase 7